MKFASYDSIMDANLELSIPLAVKFTPLQIQNFEYYFKKVKKMILNQIFIPILLQF